jgi:murein DD-endopeptidase MepM/ murein hydrolase activator NlpD
MHSKHLLRWLSLYLFLSSCFVCAESDLTLKLPTDNHYLFSNEPNRFYMYVDRTFEGIKNQPWEAGTFGFVRNAQRIQNEIVLTKFHEGIDIAPIHRDKAGNPLDLVSSIADGVVSHVSPISGHSNYGKFIVIEHQWHGSRIYSLYAHLAEITATLGTQVKAGSVIGRMGYTGAGIDRTRAHVHVELAMMLHSNFDEWFKSNAGGINHHGVYNGMNLIGTDIARLFLEQKNNPNFSFRDLVTSTPVYFKVTIPAHGTPDFLSRHPWLCSKPIPDQSISWEIAFSSTGQPVSFEPSQRQTDCPVITSIRPSPLPHSALTRNLVTGSQQQASLTSHGKKLIDLISQ